MNPYEFMQKQSLPFEAKINHAKLKAQEFYDHCEGNVFVSVGGLDSATLALFLWKYVNRDIPAASVSVLEDKSVQQLHHWLGDRGTVVYLTPLKSKVEVLREFGYPVISKDKANKIKLLQNPTEKNATVRHAVGYELSEEYCHLALDRNKQLSLV